MFPNIFPPDQPKKKINNANSRRPENLEDDPFDLVESQERAKSMTDPKQLFEYFEYISKLYDKGKIGKYQYTEMKDTVMEHIKTLEAVKKKINSSL